MKKTMLCSIILLLLYSCDVGFNHYGGYNMTNESDTDWFISLDKGGEFDSPNDTMIERIKKGTYVKFHNKSGSVDTFLMCKGLKIIDSFIEDVKYNSTFLLVDQKPLDSIFGIYQRFGDSINGYSSRKIDPSRDALKKSTFHQYWIINKKTDDIYGPFNKSEFYLKKKELCVNLESF